MYSRARVMIQSAAVVLLGILLAEMYNRETPCERDPDIVLDNTSQSSCRFFSETYEEARSKFRQACHGAELHTFQVIDDYTMDICVLNGSLPGVLVHTSGFHGVEGYAGSAIQVAWLSLFAKKQNHPSIIFVHAVNPYGMAHYRRPNENNVDLNRNGLHPDQWKNSLERDPNIANYQDFDEGLFNPRRAPTDVDRYFRIWIQAAWAIYQHGLSKLKPAMVTGQYHYDKGIFYGGRELQPSLLILWEFLETRLSQNKQTLTMIHVHTGLGPSGEDTLLGLLGESGGIPPTHELATTFTGSHIPNLAHGAANNVAAGYDLVLGTAEGFFAPLRKKDSDWILTQEFGTIPTMLVGISLILENMAHHYLPEKDAKEWTLLTRRAFYKRTPTWRRQVILRGVRVLNQAIARYIQ